MLETSAGEHEADVLVTACGQLSEPKMPGDRRASRASTARRSTRRAGATTSTSPASAWRSSAPGAVRSRPCPAIQPIVEHVDVYQRSPGWTIAKMDFEYKERTQAAVRALPGAAAAGPRRGLRLHGARGGRDDHARVAAQAVPRGGRANINKAIKDPELRAQGDAERRGRVQAGDAHRRVVSDARRSRTSSSSPTGSRRSRRPGSAPPTAPSARPTCSCSPPASSPRLHRADGDRGRGRPPAGRGVGARCRAPTSA